MYIISKSIFKNPIKYKNLQMNYNHRKAQNIKYILRILCNDNPEVQ